VLSIRSVVAWSSARSSARSAGCLGRVNDVGSSRPNGRSAKSFHYGPLGWYRYRRSLDVQRPMPIAQPAGLVSARRRRTNTAPLRCVGLGWSVIPPPLVKPAMATAHHDNLPLPVKPRGSAENSPRRSPAPDCRRRRASRRVVREYGRRTAPEADPAHGLARICPRQQDLTQRREGDASAGPRPR